LVVILISTQKEHRIEVYRTFDKWIGMFTYDNIVKELLRHPEIIEVTIVK